MQPTRKCGFASTLPCSSYIATTPYCSPHASAGLQSCYHAVHTQVRVCIRFALHPARKCRLASLSSCGPQASAGLHSRCPAAHTHVQVCNQLSRSPHASAGVHLRRPLQLTCRCGGATRRSCSPHAVQVCIAAVMYESSSYHAQTPLDKHTKSVMQPTRKCGFASASSCSLHASAGLQPRCHAAHTRVRVCINVV